MFRGKSFLLAGEVCGEHGHGPLLHPLKGEHSCACTLVFYNTSPFCQKVCWHVLIVCLYCNDNVCFSCLLVVEKTCGQISVVSVYFIPLVCEALFLQDVYHCLHAHRDLPAVLPHVNVESGDVAGPWSIA